MSKKGGRPKSDDPRINGVGFKCTAEEMEKLEKLAAEYQTTVGEFSRAKALGSRMPKVPVHKINVEKYQELSRLASNLNQLMRAVNKGKINNIDNDFVKKIYEEVSALRGNLINL